MTSDSANMVDNRVLTVIKCEVCAEETLFTKDFTWDFTFSEEVVPSEDLAILEDAFHRQKVVVGGKWTANGRTYRCCGLGWKREQ